MHSPPPEVTMQDLGKLSLRATVAFAVRCVRRLLPLLKADPESSRAVRLSVQTALLVASNFARGGEQGTDPGEAAQEAYDSADDIAPEEGQFVVYAAGHAASAAAHALQAAQQSSPTSALETVAAAWGAYRVLQTYATGRVPFTQVLLADVLPLARRDYEKLVGLNLGRFAELGLPVETTDEGPLGSL